MEKYLLALKEPYMLMLLKFRTSNHLLPIEKGRHLNIDRNERKCELCNMNDICDEYHYICGLNFETSQQNLFPESFIKNPVFRSYVTYCYVKAKKTS